MLQVNRRGKRNSISFIIVILISLYLIIPLLLTFLYSMFNDWTKAVPTGFTVQYYAELFSDNIFLQSLGRTIIISILPIIITGIVVLLAMFVIIVYQPKLEKYIQILCMMPYALQGVILATSLISIYADSDSILSDRIVMLIAAYCIIILPYMYQGIKNGITGVDAVNLIEAAEVLGVTKIYAFFRIIVPNILSGLTVSALLSMSMIFGDFAIVNLLAGAQFETTQVYLQKKLAQSGQVSSAIIMILFICTLVISGIVLFKKKKDTSMKVQQKAEQ